MPRQADPMIASANDLLTGAVVYLSREGVWDPALAEAAVSLDSEALATLAQDALRERQVIDVAFVPVALDAGGQPHPLSLRDRIRDRGPTVRPDLGRQAEALSGSAFSL